MHPIALELPVPGGVREVGSYGLLLALALLVGGAVFVQGARRRGLDGGRTFVVLAAAIAGGLAGATLLYAAVSALAAAGGGAVAAAHAGPDAPGQALAALAGGRVYLGGVVGGAVAVALAARRLGLRLSALGDAAALALPLGHAVGRLGCLLGGCCYGAPWDGPLAVVATDPRAPAAHPPVPRHPWPVYEAAASLAVAAVVAALPARRPWLRAGAYLGLYGAARVALEPLRGDAVRGVFAGVSTSQLVGAALAVGGAALCARALRGGAAAPAPASLVALACASAALAGGAATTPTAAQPARAQVAGAQGSGARLVGAQVVRAPGRVVIPAGELRRGSNALEIGEALRLCVAELGDADPEAASALCDAELFGAERPAHRVWVPAFAIDRTEVTQAAYARCVAAGACAPHGLDDRDRRLSGATLPQVSVSWREAAAYCAHVGGRLPTEAEWERAARGDGRRAFPWGDLWNGGLANHGTLAAGRTDGSDGWAHLAPVGSFPDGASPFGILDLAGNAAEWTSDHFARDHYATAPRVSPAGPREGAFRAVRGGSFLSPSFFVRAAYRDGLPEGYRGVEVGFRCAYPVASARAPALLLRSAPR
jgi:formylglycine-generating enzyme required for sulfatase activity